MMTAEEAKKYIKEFVPNDEIINNVESQIKRGERHIQVFTTRYVRSYAEDCGYRIVVTSDYDDEDTNDTPFTILYVHELQHALRLRRINKEIVL